MDQIKYLYVVLLRCENYQYILNQYSIKWGLKNMLTFSVVGYKWI